MKSAVEDTIKYIQHWAGILECRKPEFLTSFLLLLLRIPTNHIGFTYLKAAILQCHEDPTCTMVNDIYPNIRSKYRKRVSDEQMEASMRAAIQIGWSRADLHVWKLLFPTVLYNRLKKPSNTEFIFELARIVELLSYYEKTHDAQWAEKEAGCEIK